MFLAPSVPVAGYGVAKKSFFANFHPVFSKKTVFWLRYGLSSSLHTLATPKKICYIIVQTVRDHPVYKQNYGAQYHR